jgi:anti-sigma B factor antagonist
MAPQSPAHALFTVGKDDTITLTCTHVDYRNTPELKEALLLVVNKDTPKVVLNLENVDFIDSTGLGMLLFFKRHCDSINGRIALCGLKPYVSNLVCITNLHRAIPILQSVPVSQDNFA